MKPNRYSLEFYGVLYIILAVFLTALSFSSLNYYWTWEDIKIVRIYSATELIESFYKTWDTDEIETPGLRPMTVIFNHIRAYLFGERLYLQRLFLIFLFSLYLVLLCYTCNRYYKIAIQPLIMAVLLIGCSRYNFYHFLCPTDGNHILQYTFLLLSLISLLSALEKSNKGQMLIGLSILCYTVALLTREDSIAAVPALVLLSLIFIKKYNVITRCQKSYIYYLVFLLLVTAAFLLIRRLFIGPIPIHTGLAGAIRNIIKACILSLSPFGKYSVYGLNITRIWYVVLLLNLICFFYRANGNSRLSVVTLLSLVFLSCAHCVIMPRINLLFLPITFFSLALCLVIYKLARASRTLFIIESIIYIGLLTTTIHVHRIQQECLHPLEAQQISREYDYVFGEYASDTVPEVRRKYIRNKFQKLGISPSEFSYKKLRDEAIASKLRKPNKAGHIFSARLPFIKP